MDLRHLVAAETSGLADRLAAALSAEIDAAARRSQEAADAAVQKVRAEIEQSRAALAKTRTDEKAAQAALEKMRVEEKALHGTVQKLRADQTTLQTAVEKYRADEKARQAALQKLAASEKALQGTIDALQASDKTHQATIENLQATVVKLQTSEKQHQAQHAQADAGRALADAELRKVQTERDAMAEEVQRAETQALEQIRSVREQVLKIASAPLEQLRTAFQRLASAATVDDVLTALIDALGSEFSRVALFQVNGNRLEGRRQTGFDFGSDISKVIVPLTKGSALTEAVRSGRVQGLTASELTDGSRKLFGGVPSFVLILPIVSGGKIHAVIYADNSNQPQPQFATTKRSVHFAEILLCHAVPLIGKLAAERKVVADLREYCTQLLTDLESVYEGDAAAGHKGEKLQHRLQHNVEYARNIYAQRQAGRSIGADLFDAELAAIVARRTTTPFARDLAAVTGAADDSRKQAS